MKVSVLTSLNFRTHHTTYPLWVFQQELKNRGIRLRFFYRLDRKAISDSDLVCIIQWNFKRFFPPYGKNNLSDLLTYFHDRNCRILWIDDQDSSGTIPIQILKQVDLYAKNQLLKNRELYKEPVYQAVYFRNYYHELLGIEDPQGEFYGGIADEDLVKLRLSWNLAFSNWHVMGKSRVARVLSYLNPRRRYGILPTSTYLQQRPTDISYRVTDHMHAPTVSFQRNRVRELLEQFVSDQYVLKSKGKISYRAYKQEIRNSRIIPSPFGWGEVCFRDFECFEAGALLFKPSMHHLETWPDYYVPHVTYIPFEWDFSDFTLKLLDILQNPEAYQRIAAEGQRRFIDSLTFGGEEFSYRFLSLAQDALSH